MLARPLIVLACLAAAPALAQGPSAEWRTVTTPHFRVHYTAPEEAWARSVAAKLEAIRDRVTAEVGYAAPGTVDVIVSDPAAQANGMALPLLGAPRMVLWTSPPGPASVIGTYTDWTTLLALHEDAHLEHLLRPSRNPLQRLAEALLPLGPIAVKAPRWVHEGYATLVEGKLTASGRPNSDLRAALLRQRARAGTLPTYAQLASDSKSWMGMSMAYLAGSAYLEWLVERAGPDSLRQPVGAADRPHRPQLRGGVRGRVRRAARPALRSLHRGADVAGDGGRTPPSAGARGAALAGAEVATGEPAVSPDGAQARDRRARPPGGRRASSCGPPAPTRRA